MIFEFFKRNILTPCGKIIGIKRMIRFSNIPIINVFYHVVSDNYLPHIAPLYKYRNSKEFENDIDFLLKYFQPVSANDVLLHAERENRITKPSFHLSFDDGMREVYEVVLPVLKRKGIPATVFVNASFVDNKDLFYRYKAALIADKKPALKREVLKIKYPEREKLDSIAQNSGIDFKQFLKGQKPYLTTEEIGILQKNGFTIGAHSIDHPNYSLISEKEQIRQTLESCRFVKENFGEEKSFFAFPFEDTGVKKSFFETIYKNIDLTFSISGISSSQDGKNIGRVAMEGEMKTGRDIIHRALMTRLIKMIVVSYPPLEGAGGGVRYSN